MTPTPALAISLRDRLLVPLLRGERHAVHGEDAALHAVLDRLEREHLGLVLVGIVLLVDVDVEVLALVAGDRQDHVEVLLGRGTVARGQAAAEVGEAAGLLVRLARRLEHTLQRLDL